MKIFQYYVHISLVLLSITASIIRDTCKGLYKAVLGTFS